jgi:multiple sugar transport system permease protein
VLGTVAARYGRGLCRFRPRAFDRRREILQIDEDHCLVRRSKRAWAVRCGGLLWRRHCSCLKSRPGDRRSNTALARFVFPGATTYRLLILLTRAFPVAILALPLTVGFIRLGLYDTPLGVSLMHTALALPFAVLVSASLFQAIPRELEEAAWVFGCSPVRAFLQVVLPLALPGIAATAIFAFVISWNEVFAASVLTVRHKTLTAYLLSVLSESPLHVQFAGGFVLIIPSVLFIFLVRKRLFSMWGIANR